MTSPNFHVFLSHNSADKPAVEELAIRLKADGLESWLDKWHLIPGEPWQQALEKALSDSKSVAVFVGPTGFGPWQNEEMRAALAKRVSESAGNFRVIPVLLPGGTREERSRLPPFLLASTWVEFRKSLDEEEAYHRLKSGILGLPPGLAPGQSLYEGQCPYRGLQVFQPEHSAFFFGREARIEWLLNALRPSQPYTQGVPQRENRFLAIVGASGSGKSSLARAGLVPALKNGKLEGSENWPIIIFRPGHDPLENLAVALAGDKTIGNRLGDVGELISKLESSDSRLHLTIRVALGAAPETQRVVLLIDQFEEIFTLHSDEKSNPRASRSFRDIRKMSTSDTRRKAFIDNLIYAAGIGDGQVIVVLTMRADFYSKCAAYPHLAAALTDHQELVGPMTETELREVIERPAQMVGLELEPGLTEMLLSEMEDQPGALPLLQHALWELWQRREGRRLTVAAYRAIGGLEGALEQQANEIFAGLSPSEQETCRRIFLRLTQPGEGSEDTKRRVAINQLGDTAEISSVINRLANVRLITTEKDSFVEVSHEALIRSWSKLRGWIESDRESLRTQHRLTEAAAEWNQSQRDPGYLYQGARLAEAEEWSKTPESDLTREELEFLTASLELRDRGKREEMERRAREVETLKKLAESEHQRAGEQAKAARRSRWQTRAAMGLATLAVAAFFWAVRAQQQARTEQIAAIKAQKEAEDNAHQAEQARLQTEEARKQIEETLASNLLDRIHSVPGHFGLNEFSNFWQIAGMREKDEHLRSRVLSMGFESESGALRLINRAPHVARAIVGLDPERRERILKGTIWPVLNQQEPSVALRLAAVRLGIALNLQGIVGDVNFGEQAVRSLTEAIHNSTNPQLLKALADDLVIAIHSTPPEESQAAIRPIVAAIQTTSDPQVLRRFCKALEGFPGRLSPQDGRRVADRLLTIMDNTPRPEVIQELSNCLASLPEDIDLINLDIAKGIAYVVKAIESTKRSEVHDSLIAAVMTSVKRLKPAECQATAELILESMKRAHDSETSRVLARCLSDVSVQLAQTDANRGTRFLLQGMQITEEIEPLKELSLGINRLQDRLSDEDANSGVRRLLQVMSVKQSSHDLKELAENLAHFPGQRTADDVQQAKQRLFDFFANTVLTPPDVDELGTGIAALPGTLSLEEGEALYRDILAALKTVTNTESIRPIGNGLRMIGTKLTREISIPMAERVLAAMESSKDPEQLQALAQSLRGMELAIDSKQVAKAYDIISKKMQEPQLQPISLCLLVESLSIIPEDIPMAIANDAIEKMLKILEYKNSDVVALVVKNLGLVGGDISSDVGHQAISQILERIKNTRESSLVQVLCLGLSSLSAELQKVGKLTGSDAVFVVQQLAFAMDATNDSASLFSLAQSMEKVAPLIPQSENREVVRLVIEQNLRSIESTRDPIVIGQLARIWQVMARRMTQQETHDAFEKILEANEDLINKDVRPALCRAAVALANATDASHAKDALWHLLSALHFDHEENVLQIMLEGINQLAPRIPLSDVTAARLAIISTTGDHAKINEQVFEHLVRALNGLPGSLETTEFIELLKSPFCTGAAQRTLLEVLEKKTGMRFEGNPWKLVDQAKEAGIDPMKFSQPAIAPNPLSAKTDYFHSP